MNKKAICFLVVGDEYQKLFANNKPQFENYAKKCNSEIIILDKPLDETFHRPLLSQKLLIPSVMQNFDEVLFLDLDIIISDRSPSVFDFLPENKAFGAVLDPRGTEEFIETWKHEERIIKETTKDYFTVRNFGDSYKLQGSINGGVFVFRPKIIAGLFQNYYYSDHNQGPYNSFEETPMAYLTQTNDLFQPLPEGFNTQVLYKLKGTTTGKRVIEDEKNKFIFFKKRFKKKTGNVFYPTKLYKSFIKQLLNDYYFVHFAGKYPLIQ